MDRARSRRAMRVVAAPASIFVAVAVAFSLAGSVSSIGSASSTGSVRWVENIDRFGGGFGAGAATTHLFATRAGRDGRRAAS